MKSTNGTRSFTCFLIGDGSLLRECGNLLLNQHHTILGVVTPAGPQRTWAEQSSLRAIDPSSDYGSVLSATRFDYLFSINHLEKIPDRILELPRRCAINFHDGPLPRYAGLNAPAWALIYRERDYGICWHRITAAIDQGPVLKRAAIAIAADDTAVSLNTKCLVAGIHAFEQLVSDLARDAVVEEPQTSVGRSYFGKYRRPPAAALLDWSRPAAELDALVRGLQFGTYLNPLGSPKVFLNSTPYIVTSARLRNGRIEFKGLSDLRGQPVDLPQDGADCQSALPGMAERLTELDSLLCRAESFWTDRLATLTPISFPLKGGQTTRRSLRLPSELVGPFPPGVMEVTLLAVLLARFGRQTEFDLALTDRSWSQRIRGLESLVAEEACCRIRVGPNQRFKDLANAVAAELELLRKRGAWLHDLFARQPRLRGVAGTSQLPIGVALGEPATVTRPLTLICSDNMAALTGDCTAVGVLADLLEALACAVAAAGLDRASVTLPLMNQATLDRVIHEWNKTDVPYPELDCIHTQIERQVQRSPDAIALVFEEAQLTYRALNERANRLAARLIELGIGPDRLVGVHVGRSLEMVIAALAVLKAGGAYVPLDPDFPSERIGYMIKDAGLAVILTQTSRSPDFETDAQVVFVDEPLLTDASNPTTAVAPKDLAYVMYTSGSTGQPKGVMVEHRNVVNFFTAMDACIEHEPPGTWLAVTSLCFDISVLELFWTLARGFKVVIQGKVESYLAGEAPMGFSLFLWGNDDAPGRDKYRLMIEGAKYFDRNGFDAVWTPERHFHAFGGPYPNPSVTGAALAAVTERVGIRAGSCVSPLHHPIRIAEEWAVVDNLSNGRVALAFASGWQPNDFLLRPENHANNKQVMLEQIDQVRRLWRGGKVAFRNPVGQEVAIQTLPRPVQPELPFWITTAGNSETYRLAGQLGANVLTHLLGQSLDEVAEKIAVYRQAREAAGHDPAAGCVTLMLHTFVGSDDAEVRDLVRQPMKNYLRSSLKLMLDFAWAFPAFKRPAGAEKPQDVDLRSLPEAEIEAMLDFAFERYFETSGLFGTPSTCARMVDRCKRAGVDEIACLLDFGVSTEHVLASLPLLNQVRERTNAKAGPGRFSMAANMQRHGVTHLQCTPSLARMLLLDRPSRAALGNIRHMFVGGEALPTVLARELESVLGGKLRNMYGPTETTVWSTTHLVRAEEDPVPIGRPIANTQIYILDGLDQPVPPGWAGELFIGGAGVTRGYLNKPELTAERFSESPLNARFYRTGDLARFLPDGCIEFLGRADHQIKIRGYRIELQEIENLLSGHPGVDQAAVAVHGVAEGDTRLVAYVAPERKDFTDLREHLTSRLPEYMVPTEFVALARMPLTPNGKVDRKALPPPTGIQMREAVKFVTPETTTEKALAELWQEILRIDRIGANQNFFQIGGHSLLAMQLVDCVRSRFGVDLPLKNLFERPTIVSLAEAIDVLSWSTTWKESVLPVGEREEVVV